MPTQPLADAKKQKRVAWATQLLHKSIWCFFRVSEKILWILGASELRERGLRRKLAPKAPSRKCHFRGVLGRPRLAQSCSRALLAALGCSLLLLTAPGLLLAAPTPTTEPQAHPEHDTQHGQLRQTLALHSEFSKQPGVHHWARLT